MCSKSVITLQKFPSSIKVRAVKSKLLIFKAFISLAQHIYKNAPPENSLFLCSINIALSVPNEEAHQQHQIGQRLYHQQLRWRYCEDKTQEISSGWYCLPDRASQTQIFSITS